MGSQAKGKGKKRQQEQPKRTKIWSQLLPNEEQCKQTLQSMIKSAKQKGLRKNVKRHAYNCPCNRKKDIKNARGRGGSFVKYTSKRSTECPGPPRKPGQWRKCTGSNTPADCPSNFRSESVDARDCSTGDVTCTLCVRTCKCQSTGGCPVR